MEKTWGRGARSEGCPHTPMPLPVCLHPDQELRAARARARDQPCQVRVALKEDTSASYLTTCLIKFNGLVVPVKQTSTN